LVWLGGFAGILGFAAMTIVGTGRHETFERARAVVGKRVREAVLQPEVSRWAPAPLAEAQVAYRSALGIRDVAHASFWPLPDLSGAHAELDRALVLVTQAGHLAARLERERREGAEAAVSLAEGEVTRGRSAAAVLAPTGEARRQSALAALALDQARALLGQHEYIMAENRAVEALQLAERVHGHTEGIAERYSRSEQVQIWQEVARKAIESSRKSGGVAIVVWKADHMLMVYRAGRLVRRYTTELSYNWVPPKRFAGDGAIPEGSYRVVEKKLGVETMYHKALLVDYPNSADRRAFERAKGRGEIGASAAIGGLIEIHGEGGRGLDWTRGCIALRNSEIDELFGMVQIGTPVAIVGSSRPLGAGQLIGTQPVGVALQ
jgi:hypothetical protein